MSKKILLLGLLGALVVPCLALAQLEYYAPGAPQVGDIRDIIGSIELLVGFIFGAVAVISFVMAGILFLTSQGQPEKIQHARQAVIWGFVGVVVGIIAFSIIALVAGVIQGGGFGFF